MQVTAVKQQVKNPGRVSIYVDGVYAFSLSLDELVAYRLKAGIELDESKLQTLKKLSQEGKIRLRTLDWLMRRPHSTKELRDYLGRKKIDQDFAEQLVVEFTDKSYLNDAAFARYWVDIRRSGKHASNRRIRSELQQKGIKREIIHELLSDTAEDELQALQTLVQQKRRQTRYKDDDKLKAYLLRQGYTYTDIRQVLELKS